MSRRLCLLARPRARFDLRTALTALVLVTACNTSQAPLPPLPKSEGPVSKATAFFFGHSLVAQDMPAMVASMAQARGKLLTAHGQLGWGTTLLAHVEWDGLLDKSAPGGFVDDNRPPFFAGEGKTQLATGKYDVLVLTESNGHMRGDGKETVASAERLIRAAFKANHRTRAFLYANWLGRNEAEFKGNLAAWQSTTERDLRWWENVADRVNRALGQPLLHVIPGGPILARVTRAIEQGKLPGMKVDDLFRDHVHVNDRGFYVIALAHYAAIFRDTPLGLPAQTSTVAGPAEALSENNAALVQAIVWDYLKGYPRAGISAGT